MKISKIDTELFCKHCMEDTIHEIIYFEDKIERIECTKCGMVTGLDHDMLKKQYKVELIERIISKPHRMTDEFRHDMYHFLKDLPKRLITKPKRVLNEFHILKEVNHDLDHDKHKKNNH